MNLAEWGLLIGTGALLGLIGQGVRTAMGLRKLYVETPNGGLGQAFNLGKLVVSLILGLLAGIAATISSLGLDTFSFGDPVPTATIITIISAGYAGGDFLEGFIRDRLPTQNIPVQQANNPSPADDEEVDNGGANANAP